MKVIKTIYAEDGMVLTDGKRFGKIIHLADGVDTSAWHEITAEEYEAATKEIRSADL